MLRWIKGGLSHSLTLFSAVTILGINNLIFVLSLCRHLPDVLLWAGGINSLLCVLFTHIGLKKIGSPERAVFFPVYYIFLVYETLAMLLPVMLLRPSWKKKRV